MIQNEPQPFMNFQDGSLNQSERSERINQLLEKEIEARNTIVQNSKERLYEFLRNANADVCFDPAHIDFFTDAQQRIDFLTDRLNRLSRGEKPSPAEIEEVERRVDAAGSFFSGINEPLSAQLELIENQTQALYKKISMQIREYEDELLKNRELKQKIAEKVQQRQQT